MGREPPRAARLALTGLQRKVVVLLFLLLLSQASGGCPGLLGGGGGAVPEHDHIAQRLAAVPAANDDEVWADRGGCVAVAPGRRRAREPVAGPGHIGRPEGHAVVAGLLLLPSAVALGHPIPQRKGGAGHSLLRGAAPAAKEQHIVIREHERVAEATCRRRAVRAQARPLHPAHIQDADVAEVAAPQEVATVVLCGYLGGVHAEASMDEQRLAHEKRRMAEASRWLWARRLR
mmetsp:Transcript_149101/g.362083  ORF Transcript_149101/g.362083 Transcript_149101/m.362083 type:complete len:232 (+) Transcript_149101:200-895(+)